MKAISARATRGLNLGAQLIAADNSGAKIVRLVSVKRSKAAKRRQVSGKIADWVKVSVRVGIPEMKGKVFDAVIIRQKKPFRRLNGERVAYSSKQEERSGAVEAMFPNTAIIGNYRIVTQTLIPENRNLPQYTAEHYTLLKSFKQT